MKNIKYLLLSFVILMILLHTPGCKEWEGRFVLVNVEGGTTYFQASDQSLFGFIIRIANQERVGVGAIFSDWEFGIYQDDQLILEISQANYDSFNFRVSIYENTPISDSSRYFPGVLNVTSGREVDDFKVAGNLFGDKTPNKMAYRVLITDYNGYSQIFAGEILINHAVID